MRKPATGCYSVTVIGWHSKYIVDGGLEVELPTNWRWTSRGGKRQSKEDEQERERARRKKIQEHEKLL